MRVAFKPALRHAHRFSDHTVLRHAQVLANATHAPRVDKETRKNVIYVSKLDEVHDTTHTVSSPIKTAVALANRVCDRKFLVCSHWLPDSSECGLNVHDLSLARDHLDQLREAIDQQCETKTHSELNGTPLTPHQRTVRRGKVTTRRLQRLLATLSHQQAYRTIEAIPFLWDTIFPEFATNSRHWCVLYEYYAIALNQQERYAEVIEKLFVNPIASMQMVVAINQEPTRKKANADDAWWWWLPPAPVSTRNPMVQLSHSLVESLLLACGHLNDVPTARQVLEMARSKHIHLSRNAYSRLLHQLLFADDPEAPATYHFDIIVELCEEITNGLQQTLPLALQAILLRIASRNGELYRIMPYYSHSSHEKMSRNCERLFEFCLQTMYGEGDIDELIVVLQHVLKSTTASTTLKHRICKDLLRKGVLSHYNSTYEMDLKDAMRVILLVLDLMEENQFRMSHKPMYAMFTVLLEQGYLSPCMDSICQFFQRYPHVIDWNSFTVGELLVVAVKQREKEFVDQLLIDALQQDVFIPYKALEALIASIYRQGKMKKVSTIIRALQLNQHVALKTSLTEIGMKANMSLKRYEDVIALFEDFAVVDAQRKRVLERKNMLLMARDAFQALRRIEEANALQKLLEIHFREDAEQRRF